MTVIHMTLTTRTIRLAVRQAVMREVAGYPVTVPIGPAGVESLR